MIYGYARVSTRDQNLDGQLAELKGAGAAKVFSEKQSGGSREKRKALADMLASLQEGDTVLVTRLDRLARSTTDFLHIVDEIASKGAGLRSLAEGLNADTTPTGRMVMGVLAVVADFERSLIAERTKEGRERAKAEGIRFGRKPALTKQQQGHAFKLSEEQGTAGLLPEKWSII